MLPVGEETSVELGNDRLYIAISIRFTRKYMVRTAPTLRILALMHRECSRELTVQIACF
jgi:hypothetical protein